MVNQSFVFLLKVALGIAALFGAEHIYTSSQERQDLTDRCVQLMIFQAAKFGGYWVEKDDLSTRSTDGRLEVMASASRPIQWEDLEKEPDDLVADLQDDSLYMIRCTVYQNGIMTSLVIEKFTSANTWEFVDPRYLEGVDEGIEVLENKKE